jgi:membrane protein
MRWVLAKQVRKAADRALSIRPVCFAWEWLVHYVGGLHRRAGDHHIFLLAGGLAFSLFVCIVPLVLIVFAVLGGVLEKPSILNGISALIDRLIPYQRYALQIKVLVFSRVDQFIVYKDVAGIVGIGGLLFAASGLFSSIRTTLNAVYKAERRGLPLLGKLRDVGLVILVLVYFLLTTAILPGLHITSELTGRIGFLNRLHPGLTSMLVVQIGSLVASFLSFAFMYYFIPSRRAAASLWQIAQRLFGYYIAHMVTLQNVYGAYFFMVVVATWVYYSSLVLILGAEIGQLYRERRAGKLVAGQAVAGQ